MKGRLWIFGAMAAGVVALVTPAAGQGNAASASLRWSGTRSGVTTLTAYDLGAIDGGRRIVKGFRLSNVGQSTSGAVKVNLTGSSAFTIAFDLCTNMRLGAKSCRVAVAYRPSGDGTSDTATLTATGAHEAAASLKLSGRSAGPSGHVYFANIGDSGDLSAGMLRAVPRGSGKVKTLVSGQYITSVAVDGAHVYWVDYLSATVNEAPLGGGSVTTLASGQNNPAAVATDGAHVYWVNYGTLPGSPTDGTVNEVPIGGGSVTTLASGQNGPNTIAVHGTHVYWTNSGDGTVNDVPIGGGSVTTLASGHGQPYSVAVDATHVYWVSPGTRGKHYRDGTVNEVPLGGGSVTTLAGGQRDPFSVAVDGTHVYWVNERNGMVNEVPLGGGPVTTLASGQGGPTSVGVDGTHVYWTNLGDGTVNKVRLGGGRVITIARGQNGPYALAISP